MGEARRGPARNSHALSSGERRSRARDVAQYFKQQERAEILSVDNARLAAQQFAGLVLGDLVHRALLGQGNSSSKKLLEARIRSRVDAFLQIYEVE